MTAGLILQLSLVWKGRDLSKLTSQGVLQSKASSSLF